MAMRESSRSRSRSVMRMLLALAFLAPRIGSIRSPLGVSRVARPSALRMRPAGEDAEERSGTVIFLRHGESEWNNLNRFTGWVDVALSPLGEEQARQAGRVLSASDIRFDKIYTSFLQRTTRTAQLVMDEMQPGWTSADAEAKQAGFLAPPMERSWRLNERMYGALTGLYKRDIADEYGQTQFEQWVRDPPPLLRESEYYPGNDPLYADLKLDELPLKESFEDCMRRVVPLWEDQIKPDLEHKRETILVVSSRNAIRALLMHISDIPTKTLLSIDIPNGVPLMYELHKDCLKTIDSETCNFGIDGPFMPVLKSYGSD
ncbi:histidine phosphatase superfamily [Pavlovales sp. CCMP2436]|nr:histidine phosphatase superfamily [Pavlovales sp. CCMP2436]